MREGRIFQPPGPAGSAGEAPSTHRCLPAPDGISDGEAWRQALPISRRFSPHSCVMVGLPLHIPLYRCGN